MSISEQELQQHLFHWLGQHGVTKLNTRQTVVVSEAAREIVQAVREQRRPSVPESGWQAWLKSDDTCAASLYLLKCMRRQGPPVGEQVVYPTTAAAWANCDALLAAEPGFRSRLPEMKPVSTEWWILVQNWASIKEADNRNERLLQVLW